MSTHQVIGYTPEIGKALKRIMAETPQTDTGKLAYPNGKKQSTINTKAKASSGNFKYKGYFKIIDASEMDDKGKITAFKISVVDGSVEGSNSRSRFVGDDTNYYVSKYTSDPLTKTGSYIIYLEYTYENGGQIVVCEPGTHKYNSSQVMYYEIGNAVIQDAAEDTPKQMLIVQRHGTVPTVGVSNGVPILELASKGAASAYRGAFKIVRKRDTNIIGVVHGATWNGEKSDGNMPCIVNNITTYLDDSFYNMKAGTIYAYVYFKGNVTGGGTVSIVFKDSPVRTVSEEEAYYPIGSAKLTGEKSITITQSHTSGIVRMYWWATCNFGQVKA